MMNLEIIGKCCSCGSDLKSSDYGRETNCLGCGRPTRVCLNCKWYNPSKPNACEEPVAEPVVEKQRSNFCNYFEPGTGTNGGSEPTAANDHLAAAEELFKF
ncbi:MAG: hypothetical protein GY814_16510 [Gammaproteobacteria bacterium]|nr:hypothetical protein [Gammaproteobacteria bacterium]